MQGHAARPRLLLLLPVGLIFVSAIVAGSFAPRVRVLPAVIACVVCAWTALAARRLPSGPLRSGLTIGPAAAAGAVLLFDPGWRAAEGPMFAGMWIGMALLAAPGVLLGRVLGHPGAWDAWALAALLAAACGALFPWVAIGIGLSWGSAP
jgi:hypothetical protein